MVLRASVKPAADLRPVGERRRLSGLGHQRGNQTSRGGLDVVDEGMQRLGAVRGGQVGPHAFVEAAPRLGDRPLDFGKRRGGDVGDVGFVRGVLDADHVVAGHPLAGDVCPLLRRGSSHRLLTRCSR